MGAWRHPEATSAAAPRRRCRGSLEEVIFTKYKQENGFGASKTPETWLSLPKSFPHGRLQAPKPFSCLYLVKIPKISLSSHKNLPSSAFTVFRIFAKYKQGNGFGAWKLPWNFYIFLCNFQARKPLPCLYLVKTMKFSKTELVILWVRLSKIS